MDEVRFAALCLTHATEVHLKQADVNCNALSRDLLQGPKHVHRSSQWTIKDNITHLNSVPHGFVCTRAKCYL